MEQFGPTVILSDGDVVMQPRKIRRAGLWDAVGGRVLIYIHKERQLQAVERVYPAARYLMVDDKVGILTALKQHWGARVTTILPRQGHYANDAAVLAANPAPDLSIEGIGDLASYDIDPLIHGSSS
jgi:hypothetical protein